MNHRSKIILPIRIILVLILFAAIPVLNQTAFSHSATPGLNLIATVTPTVTPTLTPTVMPTMSPLLAKLKSQLAYGAGGGCGECGIPYCQWVMEHWNGNLPAIVEVERSELNPQKSGICLLGFGNRWPVMISITAPDGTYFWTTLNPSQTESGMADETAPAYIANAAQVLNIKGQPVIELETWYPPDLPEGNWSVLASSDDQSANGMVNIHWPDNTSQLYVPSRAPNPFTRRPDLYDYYQATGLYTLKSGEKLALAGAGLPANQDIPIAVYQLSETKYIRLVQAMLVRSNRAGKVTTSFQFDPKYPPGLYLIFAIADTNMDLVSNAGPFLAIYNKSCPGAPDSKLWTGDQIQLNPDLPTANNIRSQPGLKQNLLGKLRAGQTATILEGPVCADKMVWWKVSTSAGITGWTGEGKGNETWLLRIPPTDLPLVKNKP